MTWYILIAWISLAFCLSGALWHVVRLIRAGQPGDYAEPSGKTGSAIAYSFTGAMSPVKKESAFLHLPTYAAGIIYHLGTFTAILLFILSLIGISLPSILSYILACCLAVSGACGLGMLIKRFVKKGLRTLSNPDDYIANILVTLFHLVSALALVIPGLAPFCFLSASAVCLVFPFGKLKHAVYFFAARYHLGLFFGRRGVWPAQNHPEK